MPKLCKILLPCALEALRDGEFCLKLCIKPVTIPNTPQKHHLATISADGKCSSPIATIDTVEQLELIELIIDGRAMRGGIDTPTIIGSTNNFLPQSLHYTLRRFEPMDDGRCRVQYRRCCQ